MMKIRPTILITRPAISFCRNFFRGWNTFELCLFIFAITVIPILGIVFDSTIWEILLGTLTSVTTILFSKGRIEGYFLSIVTMTLGIIVALNVSVYSSIITILLFSAPMVFWGLFSWFKNRRVDTKKGNVVIVSKVGWRELCLVLFLSVLAGVGAFFILRAFDTAFLWLETLMVTVKLLASYLIARRSILCYPFYIVSDIIYIALWTLLLVGGHTGAIVLIMLGLMFFVTDIYGIYEWRRLAKGQGGGADKLASKLNDKDIELAKKILEQANLTCVAVKGDVVYKSRERGIAPIVNLVKNGVDLNGFSVADKVVGKAAAYLFVSYGIACVYAVTISEGGAEVLKKHNLPFAYQNITTQIMNRSNTGICPLEKFFVAPEAVIIPK